MMMSLLPPSSFQLCCILTHCHHSLFASWFEKVLSTLVRAGDQVPKGLAATIFATKKGKKELNAIAENLENYFEVYHYNRQLGDDKKKNFMSIKLAWHVCHCSPQQMEGWTAKRATIS
jgi:hypothetical protein